MNTAGTIDRPLTHDPKKQAPMKPSTSEPAGSAIPDFTTTGANDSRQNRTREMQLIPEALARAHMHERLHEADRERLAARLASARRMQRRAERASLRARRALAMAVMH
ncbi:hypothetical protein ACFV8Z_23605 [Streptomyces sp. NPDC059837]|jgi:hypothetical protein|uniref:hypothetical protein n=1 Tax=unclassified Streptomyces TaxID=2593676 RepID=UPI0022521411|nr:MULTISPECIES: hypothetical protein [unclassified Streptomyces]MCX4408167.1 hypothetical protein [Streptomyces sp. NBC_01764]MCX4456663.1 hypothetical protein [Streptomyces sp. NBC_01719]MCX4496021.1 hypothetical protein [Streptomyces sp. NBC_01728]MCX4589389.1 hypothetical protein [Streptomyces sp. NBC_01549]MCX5092751.1 hypothetical protein [Streptomyces sp. NBC_00365]